MSDSEYDEEDLVYSIVYDDDNENTYNYLIKKDGRGKATYTNGDTYNGSFENGKKHGKGVYTWKNGACFDGSYDNGMKVAGTMKYPDGSQFIGTWSDNCKNGIGTYSYPNGDTYHGEYVNGIKAGQGTYVYGESGAQLSGQWNNNECAEGCLKYADGSKWIGSFEKNSRPCGPGQFIFTNGLSQKGIYKPSGQFVPI